MLSKSKLKQILGLKQKKIRAREQLFLIEGLRLCEEALQSDFEIQSCLLDRGSTTSETSEHISQLADRKNIEIIDIDRDDVRKIADTVHSQGIFCIVRQKRPSPENFFKEQPSFLLFIDAGQDPGNVGTLIRTADWFGFDAVFLGKGSVELFNDKLIRATMGSFFHLPLFPEVILSDMLPILKEKQFSIFSAEVGGEKFYHQIRYSTPLALILGNENSGVSDKISRYIDQRIQIPAFGKAESLNLAQAGAVIMSQIRISN